mmetsp:Transcript_98141/g.311279  ORF Transcript_98141/g.311279 Transcript_98141/m.311279 type:complete len:314 (-) Transcript_98141:295-1236(-)
MTFVLVPTTKLGTDTDGLVWIADAWPASPVALKFADEEAASRTRERLQETVLSVTQSLHLRAPAGAPLLTLRPLSPGRQQCNEPCDHGPLLLGGYALVGRMDILSGKRLFGLFWVELRGPDPDGVICLYSYSSHLPDGDFLDEHRLRLEGFHVARHVLRIHGHCPGRGGITYSWEVPKDRCIAFRCAEEAQLWADMATAALKARERRTPKELLPQAASRVEQVVAVLERRARSSRAAAAPLLEDGVRTRVHHDSEPDDEIAQFARERQQHDLNKLTALLTESDDTDFGTVNFGTTAFGTANYTGGSFGTTNYS